MEKRHKYDKYTEYYMCACAKVSERKRKRERERYICAFDRKTERDTPVMYIARE